MILKLELIILPRHARGDPFDNVDYRTILRSPSRRGRRNYPVNAHRPAGLLITTNLPVSLRRKQVPHKFYPVYGGDAIMTTKLAQINYARTCRCNLPLSFPHRSPVTLRTFTFSLCWRRTRIPICNNLVNRFRGRKPPRVITDIFCRYSYANSDASFQNTGARSFFSPLTLLRYESWGKKM